MEEALDLWSAILMQSPAPAPPVLLSLLPALFPIFEDATDSVPQAMQIAESYVLLAPQEVLSDRVRFPLLAACKALLKSTTRQRLGSVPRLVEMIIRCAALVDSGSSNTYAILTQTLLETSFLPSLLEGLHSAYEASQTTGPHKKSTPIFGVVETDYFSVLARLALGNAGIFAPAISAATGTPEEQCATWLLTEWFLHYDNIGSVTQKKLHVLALTELLSLNAPNMPPPPYILNHLQSYLTIWTDIVTELADEADSVDPNNPQSSGRDYLVFWNDKNNNYGDDGAAAAYNDETEPPENKRRSNWDRSDAVHQFNIRDFVRDRLQSVIVRCGGVDRFREDWLCNVDEEVVVGFGGLGIM